MAERVDVCIVGSGFGGSIAAWRLAELYGAAGERPSVVVLERGQRLNHTDFRQSMDVDHLSRCYTLIQGTGAQMVVGNLVGGSSNLYLAASLRAPSETFERTDVNPADGPRRRLWPSAISRRTLNRHYARAEAALRVQRPSWRQVSKSGGAWAAALAHAGHSCDRVPLAIDLDRCVDAKWCHTGCAFGAKNSVLTNYLASAEREGVEVRPLHQVELVRQSSARPYRYVVQASKIDPETKQPVEAAEPIECKVLIMAAGAMGTPPILMRSRLLMPSLSNQLGRHLGVNGDHVAGVEFSRRALRRVLDLPDGAQFFKGKPITTMTYDWWTGRRARRFDGTRFTLQEIFLSQLTNFLYDHGRGGEGPSWWGRKKKRSVARWSDRVEILAMVEDTHDGQFLLPNPTGNGHLQPNGGPIGIGMHTFNYSFSERSVRVRERADEAIESVVRRRGLGRFLKLTQTEGAYAAHPLGGCRMADSKAGGVVDDGCEAFGYEGLFCMDSSAIPTSLGVNPSLTIAAVAERAAERLVARAGDLGLPAPSGRVAHGVPGRRIGPHMRPARR